MSVHAGLEGRRRRRGRTRRQGDDKGKNEHRRCSTIGRGGDNDEEGAMDGDGDGDGECSGDCVDACEGRQQQWRYGAGARGRGAAQRSAAGLGLERGLERG